MPQPIASLSLDLDNKWSYMKTHGDRGWESFPSYLDVVVPRFLGLLDELGLRITVFVVGQDAALAQNRAAARHALPRRDMRSAITRSIMSRGCTSIRAEQIEEEIAAAEDAIFSGHRRRARSAFAAPAIACRPPCSSAWRGAAISTTLRRSPRSSGRSPGRTTFSPPA